MKAIVAITALPLVSANGWPLARFSYWFGVETFHCQNPSTLTNFNPSLLQGKWFQTNASWGTKVFGCVWMEFRNSNNGDAT